jgi:hypothetical protein
MLLQENVTQINETEQVISQFLISNTGGNNA